MSQAMGEVIGYVNRARAFMPPGTVPPFIMRFDAGSVPVGAAGLLERRRAASARCRTSRSTASARMFATLPGVSAPPPFGGSQRTIVVRVDPDKLRAYRMSPDEVVYGDQPRDNRPAVGQRAHRRPDPDRADECDGRRQHPGTLDAAAPHRRRADRYPARHRHRRDGTDIVTATRTSTASAPSTSR